MPGGPWKRGIQQSWKYLHEPKRIFWDAESNALPSADKYGLIPLLSPAQPASHFLPPSPSLLPPTSGKSSCICFAWNTHQHSNRCHLATESRLQHIRPNKKPAQKEKQSALRFLGAKITGIPGLHSVTEAAWNPFMPCTLPNTLSWPWDGDNVLRSVLLLSEDSTGPSEPRASAQASVGQFRATRINWL